MTNSSTRDQQLKKLQSFGKLLAEIHERALSVLQSDLATKNSALVHYLDALKGKQARELAIAQFALESALHDLLLVFHEAEEFRIQGRAESGLWFDLAAGSWGLHGDLMSWLDEQSQFGCLLRRIAQTNLDASEGGHHPEGGPSEPENGGKPH
jgi:hypothetical protein